MSGGTSLPRELLEAVSETARRLQPGHARRLAVELGGRRGPTGSGGLAAAVPAPGFAATVTPLLEVWQHHPTVTGDLLGAAVAAAAQAHDDARRQPRLEIVMSGPASRLLHPRRTEQALLQLIGDARQEILLVTYNLTMYDQLRQALAAATDRGVVVTVLAEDPQDRPSFTGDPVAALLGIPATRLRWPADQRGGQWAAVHAKLVLVDRELALVSSANLSETAANDSLEAGILIRGGDIPRRLALHLQHLRASGVLISA